MSQAGDISSTIGPFPPFIPTSFVTEDGTAIPSSNVINILTDDSTENSDLGIITRADPNLSENVYIILTNRARGTATTVDASTADLITFPLLNIPTVYRFHFAIVGLDSTNTYAVGYTVFGSVKTDGITAAIVAEIYVDDDEDMVLDDAVVDVVTSGNNIILQVTGVLGYTINFKALMTYTVLT